MKAYYNDNDKSCCAWLKELIKQGLIPEGDVDERSIAEVKAEDLKGYTQCHFFAGIGGWPLALQLAGWPSDRHVWTASCPCQPLSGAGVRQGERDERHLWPILADLIKDGNPPVVFGEQVASKDGREWLSGVRADLEAMEYAVGASDLCSASVSAPNIRQRVFWVADSEGIRPQGRELGQGEVEFRGSGPLSSGRLGESSERGCGQGRTGQEVSGKETRGKVERPSVDSGLADSESSERKSTRRTRSRGQRLTDGGTTGNFWSDFDLIPCRDGKSRRVESGTFPLAHGVPNRVGLLRGYGNSINPQVAKEFIESYIELKEETCHKGEF